MVRDCCGFSVQAAESRRLPRKTQRGTKRTGGPFLCVFVFFVARVDRVNYLNQKQGHRLHGSKRDSWNRCACKSQPPLLNPMNPRRAIDWPSDSLVRSVVRLLQFIRCVACQQSIYVSSQTQSIQSGRERKIGWRPLPCYGRIVTNRCTGAAVVPFY